MSQNRGTDDQSEQATERYLLKRLRPGGREESPPWVMEPETPGPLPIAWLLIGGLAGLLTVGLLGLGLISIVRKQGARPPIVLTPTAPIETSVPAALPGESTPALVPTYTSTPLPTPVLPTPTSPPPVTPTQQAPDKITVGGYVRVQGTEGAGLSLRSGPGTNYARYKIVSEGTVLKVLQEPREGEGYTWWFLRDPEGVEGWAANTFLVPAAAP
jgi:hypothetical protein